MRNLYTLVTLASIVFSTLSAEAVNNRGFRPDMSFLDFEDVTEFFHPKHKQTVHIIKHKDSPVEITNAEVSDRGTVFFSGLSGVKNTYSVKVKNNSDRKVLAYEITWVLKHPFEDYVFHKIHSNSIDPIKVGGIQELKFRRGKHYRDDAYYYVEISKVEFDDDESIWEAPELNSFKQHSRLDAVKEQIDAMGDEGNLDVIDQKTLDALKEKYSDLKEEEEEDNDDDLKDRVELQEIKTKTIIKTEPVVVKETQPTVTETKKTSIETKTTEVITTEETIEPITDPEPILDPQKLMQAVDELLKSNAVLESDLVETTTTTVESTPVTETKIIETTEIIPEANTVKTTSPIVETTIIETKPTVKTTETQVIQTKELQTTTDDDYEDDDDDFDFEDDDDDFDFEDDDDDFDFDDDDEDF